MRIVAWNLAHQTHERKLSPDLLPALEFLAPDIVTFNEFVDGDSRLQMREDLKALGLSYDAVSTTQGKDNQVFVASRTPFERGDLRGPDAGPAAQSNFLHFVLKQSGLEIVSMRVPTYPGSKDEKAYWTAFESLVASVSDRRVLFLGDLNAELTSQKPSAKALRRIAESGWQIPHASGDWSYRVKSGASWRIDHALMSPSLPTASASYFTTLAGKEIVGGGKTFVSDHAALVVDVPDR